MTNNQFEEWLEKDIREAYGDILPESVILSTIEYWKEKAHAIRDKVLHEAIEALPEEIDPERPNCYCSQCESARMMIEKAKQSLLNLLTKE